MGDARAQCEGRVSHPTRDHHLRTGLQGSGNLKSAEVDIRADEARSVEAVTDGIAQAVAGIRGAEVVALDHRDAGGRKPALLRQALNATGRPGRVGCPEVSDDRNAMCEAVGQHRSERQFEQGLEAPFGVGPAGEVGRGERALGQGLEDQRAGATPLDEGLHHRPRRIDPVAGEAGAAPYRDRRLRRLSQHVRVPGSGPEPHLAVGITNSAPLPMLEAQRCITLFCLV